MCEPGMPMKWKKRQRGGILMSLQCKNQETEKNVPGLHKNTSHAYSQDVLSFMLGRKKCVHSGNKKGNNERQNGKNHRVVSSPTYFAHSDKLVHVD